MICSSVAYFISVVEKIVFSTDSTDPNFADVITVAVHQHLIAAELIVQRNL
jgi:hypothetical protein